MKVMSFNPLSLETIDIHIERTLQWLIESIRVTEGKGSAGYYHIWKGWSESYPETTGYLIETLFDAYHLTKIESLKLTAVQCADWLCTLQLPNGAFLGGIGGKLPSLIFDTGMVLLGLRRVLEETKEENYFKAMTRATEWLEKEMDNDFIWRKHAYIEGFTPTYYTMVIWSMLMANMHLNNKDLEEKLSIALNILTQKTIPQSTNWDWGFSREEPAYTHTIVYTLHGMLEAGLLLKYKEIIYQSKSIAVKILNIRQKKGKLPGTFDKHWEGNYSFGCLTGQAQMSLLYFRLYQKFGDPVFLQEGQFLLWQMLRFQSTVKIAGWYGGIPGSAPIWGEYQRFKFPNWGAKFFLDALIVARQYAH